jgi:hypothetical protein
LRLPAGATISRPDGYKHGRAAADPGCGGRRRDAGFLLENLVADGFRAVGATSAGEGVRAIEVRRPSPVVLDLALENGSGLELLDPAPGEWARVADRSGPAGHRAHRAEAGCGHPEDAVK